MTYQPGPRLAALLVGLLPAPATVDAATWYVRPAGSAVATTDGHSFETAFVGLGNVPWGAGGVDSGDTLMVCGVHYHTISQRRAIRTQARLDPPSGHNARSPTIIDGNCVEPGVIWGAALLAHETWQPEGGTLWSIRLPASGYPDWYFVDVDSTHRVLHRAASLDALRTQPLSQFSDTYAGQHGARLYVHVPGGQPPRVWMGRWGYHFRLHGKAWLTFRNLQLYNPAGIPRGAAFHHLSWHNVRLWYGEHALLAFGDGVHDIEVLDSELAWAENGIYNISTGNDAPRRYRYQRLFIHDIGVRTRNNDAHAIGIQGGEDGLIADSVLQDCGKCLVLYAFTDQHLRRTRITGNVIRRAHMGTGIQLACNNDSLSDKSGIRIDGNRIEHAATALRIDFEDRVEVDGNHVVGADVGLLTLRNHRGRGASIHFHHNRLEATRRYHVVIGSGAAQLPLELHDNIYGTGAGFRFRQRALTLAGWQHIHTAAGALDAGSVLAGP